MKRIIKYLWLFSLILPVASAYANPGHKYFEVIDYSPFRNSQTPWGEQPSRDQIQEDIRILKEYTDEIRIYSMGGSTQKILDVCLQEGIGVHLQAWLGPERDNVGWKAANENEIRSLISTANQYGQDPQKRNLIKSLIVGSENLYRRDYSGHREMEEEDLIRYIEEVKEQTKGTFYPVTTAQIYPDYSARLALSVDRILYHVHPFWENLPIEKAADRVIETIRMMKNNLAAWEASGATGVSQKSVWIGETGWPTHGANHGDAVPSEENQMRFLQDLRSKLSDFNAAQDSKVHVMYFDAFDEAWKGNQEGNVGGYWGLFSAERQPKSPLGKPLMLRPAANSSDCVVRAQK